MATRKKGLPVPGGGVVRFLETTGIRKGMAGNRAWFYVGTGLWTLRTVRRMAERKEEVLISERLQPGQRIIIANGRATLEGEPLAPAATGRRGRKAARRAARRGSPAAS